MKRNFLLIFGIMIFTISAKAQNSSKVIFENDKLKVETKQADCNLNNNAISHTYSLLHYTNKTADVLTVDFEVNLWYNDVFQDMTNADKTNVRSITLNPNDVLYGECNTSQDYLKVLYKHNHPKMDIQQTDIQIAINKIK